MFIKLITKRSFVPYFSLSYFAFLEYISRDVNRLRRAAYYCRGMYKICIELPSNVWLTRGYASTRCVAAGKARLVGASGREALDRRSHVCLSV